MRANKEWKKAGTKAENWWLYLMHLAELCEEYNRVSIWGTWQESLCKVQAHKNAEIKDVYEFTCVCMCSRTCVRLCASACVFV
eukprot:804362-Pelagomonas_calceolata.AAC.1